MSQNHKENKTQNHVVQVGCGVVGSAYAFAYKGKGFKVTCVEASKDLVKKYEKNFTMKHVSDDFSDVKNVDFIMVSVCTPLKGKRLNLIYLWSTIPNVVAMLENSPNAIVVIRSTVPPGTTKEYKKRLIDRGQNPTVCFQPEFLRAKSANEDALNPWCVVLGTDLSDQKKVTKLIELYTEFVASDKIFNLTIEEAEVQKMFHNSFNAAKISWFNQAAILCEKITETHGYNIDMNKIAKTMVYSCEGLINPRYGTKTKHGYYGTCLPKDSAELSSLEKMYGLTVPLFDSVVQVNNIVVKTDTQEHLDGDHHVTYEKLVTK